MSAYMDEPRPMANKNRTSSISTSCLALSNHWRAALRGE